MNDVPAHSFFFIYGDLVGHNNPAPVPDMGGSWFKTCKLSVPLFWPRASVLAVKRLGTGSNPALEMPGLERGESVGGDGTGKEKVKAV